MEIKVKHLKVDKNISEQRCFGGAWYHKVMSVPYVFYGMEAVVTLPMPFIKRYEDGFLPKGLLSLHHKNLDVSSIYMGGHAKDELDVGLALFKGELNGKMSEGSCVYRPFWRYITDEFEDVGTYDLENKRFYAASLLNNTNGIKNIYAQYHPSFTEYYYLPGDKLKMTLYSPKPNFMQLKIEVLELSNMPYSIYMRKTYKYKDPQTFITPVFSSKGHGTDMIKTYKRVNAIDQVKNEGKIAIASQTKILNSLWHECYLYYKEADVLYKTPMTDENTVTMQCPEKNAFYATKMDAKTGRQMVSICPKEATK